MIDRISALEVLADAIEVRTSNRLASSPVMPGWGRRVIESAVEIAGQAGFEVVTARAFRAEAKLPYGVVTQLLGSPVGGSRAERGRNCRIGLARSWPASTRESPRGHRPWLGSTRPVTPSQAFLALVESVAATRPLLVTIDGAQWIDVTSANLVSFQRRANGARLLLILSVRDRLRSIRRSGDRRRADSSISFAPPAFGPGFAVPDIDVGPSSKRQEAYHCWSRRPSTRWSHPIRRV
jgi:hypothetical protein